MIMMAGALFSFSFYDFLTFISLYGERAVGERFGLVVWGEHKNCITFYLGC